MKSKTILISLLLGGIATALTAGDDPFSDTPKEKDNPFRDSPEAQDPFRDSPEARDPFRGDRESPERRDADRRGDNHPEVKRELAERQRELAEHQRERAELAARREQERREHSGDPFRADSFGGRESDRAGQERAVQNFLRQRWPEALPRLNELRENNREEYAEVLSEAIHIMHEYREIRTYNPDLAEVFFQVKRGEAEARMIAEHFHHTDNPEERERLRNHLREHLMHVFERKMILEEAEIRHLAEEMEELQKKHHRRMEMRERIVHNRLSTLLGEDEALEW